MRYEIRSPRHQFLNLNRIIYSIRSLQVVQARTELHVQLHYQPQHPPQLYSHQTPLHCVAGGSPNLKICLLLAFEPKTAMAAVSAIFTVFI